MHRRNTPAAIDARPARRPFGAVVRAVVATLIAMTAGAAAAQTALDEYEVKAALVVNIARYVEWPEAAFPARETPFVLCIAGRDPFGAALASREGRPLVQSRELRVRRGVTADDMTGCHLLFVPETEERRLPLYLRGAGNAPVLLVGDSEGFVQAGGAVGLVLAESRISLEVNLPSATRGGMRPSSHLLGRARSVIGATRK